MNLYKLLGLELRKLFDNLFTPGRIAIAVYTMEQIVKIADRLGSPMREEALVLQKDVEHYLRNSQDPKALDAVKKHGLRLEQETREL